MKLAADALFVAGCRRLSIRHRIVPFVTNNSKVATLAYLCFVKLANYSKLLSYEQILFKDGGLYGCIDDEPDNSGQPMEQREQIDACIRYVES